MRRVTWAAAIEAIAVLGASGFLKLIPNIGFPTTTPFCYSTARLSMELAVPGMGPNPDVVS